MNNVLRDGLSFCRVGEQFVFLDISYGRYFVLSGANNATFADWLAGQKVQSDAQNQLLASGIFIRSEASDELNQGVNIDIPEMCLSHSAVAEMRMTLRAVVELRRAKASVKRDKLPDIIAALRLEPSPTSAISAFRVAERVSAALQRAGRIISTRDACLAKSISAMRMLSGFDSSAKLVFGVRLHPFMAHCWVQNEYGLITDHFDHVESFTPILVI
jgi:Transglutaminase-like superfamily